MTWKRRSEIDSRQFPYCDHCDKILTVRDPDGLLSRLRYTEVIDLRGARHFCSKDCRDAFHVIHACLEITGWPAE